MSEVGLNPLAILMLLAIWGARVMWQMVSYRRRVRARLLRLCATDSSRGRELPWGNESARRRLGTTASSAKIT